MLDPRAECFLSTGHFCIFAIGGVIVILLIEESNSFSSFCMLFFSVISERIPWMSLFLASFSSSLYMLKKHFNLLKDGFQKSLVCPKCNSLYNYNSAFEKVGSQRVSKKCSCVDFPNHRQRAHRKPCNEVLLKEVKDETVSYLSVLLQEHY